MHPSHPASNAEMETHPTDFICIMRFCKIPCCMYATPMTSVHFHKIVHDEMRKPKMPMSRHLYIFSLFPFIFGFCTTYVKLNLFMKLVNFGYVIAKQAFHFLRHTISNTCMLCMFFLPYSNVFLFFRCYIGSVCFCFNYFFAFALVLLSRNKCHCHIYS